MSEFERIEKLQASLIKAELRAAATAEGIADGMLADVLNYDRAFQVTDSGEVRTHDGATPRTWLKNMRKDRPHWFGEKSSGGKIEEPEINPWRQENWSKTLQGQIFKKDEKLASFMLDLHKNNLETPPVDTQFLRKYIAYAKKNIVPKLTDAAVEELKEYFIKMRASAGSGASARAVPISARQLEGLVRLSEGHAKMHENP